jgi:hypothetical protein
MIGLLETPYRLAELEFDSIAPIARAALGDDAAEIVEWRIRPLAFDVTAPTTGGLYRCAGMATTRGARSQWSVILKVIKSLADFEPIQALPRQMREQVMAEWVWDREALIYQSGLLEHLPGDVRAARCFDVQRLSNDHLWLWLEDLGDTTDSWTADHFGRAGRAVGRLNGLLWPPPEGAPWLARGFLGRLVDNAIATLHLPVLADPRSWQEPLVRRSFPEALVARLLQLWEDRAWFLQTLAYLPRAFCHHDACRANLPQRRAPDGSVSVVAIDWAFAGVGAIGEDVGHLLGSAIVHPEAGAPESPDTLRDVILAGYVDGLRATGRRVDERLVWLGCAITAVLRWAFSAPQVSVRPALWDAATQQQGRSIAEIVEREAEALRWLLGLADDVRRAERHRLAGVASKTAWLATHVA